MHSLVRLLGICLLLLIPFFACMDRDDGETEGCGPYSFDLDGDSCRGVVCPSDGNECTDEYCSGGTCKSRSVSNGTSCTYDGISGVCVWGECGQNLCEGIDCNDDNACTDDACDYVDGLCDHTPVPYGTSCDDGDDEECMADFCTDDQCIGAGPEMPNGTPCTYDDLVGVCVDGVCGENLCEDVDCDDGDACTDGTCDYVDGTCDFTPIVCDDAEACTDDACDPTDGCIFTAVEDGTACAGGTCQAGVCRWIAYPQDFESLDQLSQIALSDDGWLVFGQVVDANEVLKFGYGPFPAPNGTPGFCSIVAGEGGPDQGAQQLVVYNDYNCCWTTNEGHFNGTDRVVSSVFQQPFAQGDPISANDVGKTLEFSFDAKRGDINDPTGSSTALAFIQTVDPSAGFAQTNLVSVDMTNLRAGTWDRYSISLTIDAGLVGQYLEFGFSSTASNFEPSGVFYDNVLARTIGGGTGGMGGAGGGGGTGVGDP